MQNQLQEELPEESSGPRAGLCIVKCAVRSGANELRVCCGEYVICQILQGGIDVDNLKSSQN